MKLKPIHLPGAPVLLRGFYYAIEETKIGAFLHICESRRFLWWKWDGSVVRAFVIGGLIATAERVYSKIQ